MIVRLIGHDISPPSQIKIDSVVAFSPTTTSNIPSRGIPIQSAPFKPLTYMSKNDSLGTSDQDDKDTIPQASLKNLKKTINEIENSIDMGEEIMKETNSYLQKVEDILARKTEEQLIETDIVSKNIIQDDDNDIIQINLGCKTIVTTRSTVNLAEGSKFSNMLSGQCDNDLTLDKGK